MTALEIYADQIRDGKERKQEDNIILIDPKRCRFKPRTKHGMVDSRKKSIEATIVGAYFYDYWHPYVYKAYHIILDDGSKTTIPAQWIYKSWMKEEEVK